MAFNRLFAGAVALVTSVAAGATAPMGVLVPAAAAQSTASSVSLPEPVRVKLSNGLTLLVIERHNLPIVSVSAVIRAGDAYDPADKAGLASLTADLLQRGTSKRTAPQIAGAIDFVGGSLSTSASPDSTSASLSVLKRDLATGLDVFSDVLLHPTFPEPELKRAKEEAAAGLASSLDDADAVARRAFDRTLLKGHPYGTAATLGSLRSISRADVERFYQTYYRPNNAFMAVVGDLSPEEAKEEFEQAFAGWTAKPVAAPPIGAPAGHKARRVVLVDMPVNQSFIVLGNMGVKRNTPDFFPLTVLNFILGGDFTSRLNQEIRDRQGLAYGAGSRFGYRLAGGTFAASLNTKTESTGQALTSLIKEMRTIQEQPVTDQELSFAKDYLTGAFPLRFETNADLAREVVTMEFYGLPKDYLATYRDRICAVTKEDIQRVARTYLHPEAYDLVVVGKAASVKKALEPFGPVSTLKKQSLIQ